MGKVNGEIPESGHLSIFQGYILAPNQRNRVACMDMQLNYF